MTADRVTQSKQNKMKSLGDLLERGVFPPGGQDV